MFTLNTHTPAPQVSSTENPLKNGVLKQNPASPLETGENAEGSFGELLTKQLAGQDKSSPDGLASILVKHQNQNNQLLKSNTSGSAELSTKSNLESLQNKNVIKLGAHAEGNFKNIAQNIKGKAVVDPFIGEIENSKPSGSSILGLTNEQEGVVLNNRKSIFSTISNEGAQSKDKNVQDNLAKINKDLKQDIGANLYRQSTHPGKKTGMFMSQKDLKTRGEINSGTTAQRLIMPNKLDLSGGNVQNLNVGQFAQGSQMILQPKASSRKQVKNTLNLDLAGKIGNNGMLNQKMGERAYGDLSGKSIFANAIKNSPNRKSDLKDGQLDFTSTEIDLLANASEADLFTNNFENKLKLTTGIGEAKASAKVFDLSNVELGNSSEIVEKISNYIEHSRIAGKDKVSFAVKHQDLGQLQIEVLDKGKNTIDLNIVARQVEGKEFFQSNQAKLLDNLFSAGFKVSELNIDSGSMSKDFSGGEKHSNENNFAGGQESRHNKREHSQDSQRRRDLWQEFKERKAA